MAKFTIVGLIKGTKQLSIRQVEEPSLDAVMRNHFVTRQARLNRFLTAHGIVLDGHYTGTILVNGKAIKMPKDVDSKVLKFKRLVRVA